MSTDSKLVPSEVCHIRFTTPNPATPAHKIYPHQLHRKNRKKKAGGDLIKKNLDGTMTSPGEERENAVLLLIYLMSQLFVTHYRYARSYWKESVFVSVQTPWMQTVKLQTKVVCSAFDKVVGWAHMQ